MLKNIQKCEIKYLIKVNNNSDNYDDKYLKIRINSNDDLAFKNLKWLYCGYYICLMWLYLLDLFLLIKINIILEHF